MTQSDRPDDTLSASGADGSPIRRFTMLVPGAVFAARYRIEARLGAGGVGEVYRAFDQLGQAFVALKVLFPRGEDAGHALDRLRRELRILRGLDHPGIVRVHDIGESEGLLFLVMDLLQGETLRARMKREPVSLDETLQVATDLLEALAVAHANGVVHRDIKPANIFLTESRAVLVDFGLARQTEDAQLTATADFLGTPEYVAPEQVKSGRAAGPAADVYSLGIVLWEMLSGAPPFRGDSAAQVLIAHLQQTLPALASGKSAAPNWLREIVVEMLEKDPQRRIANAAIALGRIRSRRRRPGWRRIWHVVSRTKRGQVLGAVSALLVVVAAYVGLLFFPRHFEADSNRAAVSNTFGDRLTPIDSPYRIVAAVPRHASRLWNREYLALFQASRNRPSPHKNFPSNVAVVDVLTRSVQPAPIPMVNSWLGSPAPWFPRFDDCYSGRSLQILPWQDAYSEPMFAAVLYHESSTPSVAVVFSERSGGLLMVPSAGHIQELIPIGKPGDPPDRQFLLIRAESLPLGNRQVLFAIPCAPEWRGSIVVGLPPFDLEAGPSWGGALTYFTTTSLSRGTALTVRGDVIELNNTNSSTVHYDLWTGAPTTGDEKPLDAPLWIKNQKDLVETLRVAEGRSKSGNFADAAARMRTFSQRAGLSVTQQGVALSRAAFFHRRAGNFNAALELCSQANKLEPQIFGHLRMRIDLLSRLGRWAEGEEIRVLATNLAGGQEEVKRDSVVGGLVAGELTGVGRLLRTRIDSHAASSYEFTNRAMYLIQKGDFEGAAAWLDSAPELRADAVGSMLGAIAHAMKPIPDEAAWDLLRIAEESRGDGRVFPVMALKRRLAKARGEVGPTDVEVDQEMQEQYDYARDDIVGVWWARIGDELRKASRTMGKTGSR